MSSAKLVVGRGPGPRKLLMKTDMHSSKRTHDFSFRGDFFFLRTRCSFRISKLCVSVVGLTFVALSGWLQASPGLESGITATSAGARETHLGKPFNEQVKHSTVAHTAHLFCDGAFPHAVETIVMHSCNRLQVDSRSVPG